MPDLSALGFTNGIGPGTAPVVDQSGLYQDLSSILQDFLAKNKAKRDIEDALASPFGRYITEQAIGPTPTLGKTDFGNQGQAAAGDVPPLAAALANVSPMGRAGMKAPAPAPSGSSPVNVQIGEPQITSRNGMPEETRAALTAFGIDPNSPLTSPEFVVRGEYPMDRTIRPGRQQLPQQAYSPPPRGIPMPRTDAEFALMAKLLPQLTQRRVATDQGYGSGVRAQITAEAGLKGKQLDNATRVLGFANQQILEMMKDSAKIAAAAKRGGQDDLKYLEKAWKDSAGIYKDLNDTTNSATIAALGQSEPGSPEWQHFQLIRQQRDTAEQIMQQRQTAFLTALNKGGYVKGGAAPSGDASAMSDEQLDAEIARLSKRK